MFDMTWHPNDPSPRPPIADLYPGESLVAVRRSLALHDITTGCGTKLCLPRDLVFRHLLAAREGHCSQLSSPL